MKKALVILLALTMVMSMFAMLPFGASAAEEELTVGAVAADYKPEGTAINSAADFAAMAADGKYYLAADIAVDATYPEAFTGTFDGNGKIITTTTALFAALDGTVKNLTIDGKIEYTVETTEHEAEGYTGALANVVGKDAPANVINVANKASITGSVGAVGGVVGMVAQDGANAIVFNKVANYGSIVSSSGANNGGVAATVDGSDGGEKYYIQFIDCANYGTINSVGRVGGIIGYTNASTKFEKCYNAGDIIPLSGQAAGVCGVIAHGVPFLFDGCTNDGNVTAIYQNGGGILGRIENSCTEVIIKNCVNNGDVYVGTVIDDENSSLSQGGIVGGTSYSSYPTINFVIENCTNNGAIGSPDMNDTQSLPSDYYQDCGGIMGLAYPQKDSVGVKLLNCTNNGEVKACLDAKGTYAGGIVGRVLAHGGKAFGYSIPYSIVGCINNGDIASIYRAGGMAGEVFTTSHHGYLIIDRCGNSGKITGVDCAGGFIGRFNLNQGQAKLFNSGANITGSFNVGDIYSEKYAGGLVAYAPFGSDVTIENNYVMGDIKSAVTATAKKSGESVKQEVPYSIETKTKGTLYFMVPASGTITLEADDTLTYKAGSALKFKKEDIKSGASVAQGGMYTFTTSDGKQWATLATKAGTITITERNGARPAVTVDGVELYATPWNTADNMTFENWPTLSDPITLACALVWDRLNAHDFSNNYVLEGTAGGLNAHLGFGLEWYAMEYCTEAKTFTEDDVVDGTLAYNLNKDIGEAVFRQNLVAELFEVDAYPTTDQTHAKVVEIGGKLTNVTFDTTNDSGSPATGDATIYVVVALAVSTISLAAVAVARKNKEN